MKKTKKTVVCVSGMHCASCDLLVSSKFQEIDNVKSVKADHVSQKVEVEYEGELDKKKLENSIKEFGYSIVDEEIVEAEKEPFAKRVTDAVVLGMIMLMLYFLAGEFNLIPEAMMTSLNLGSAFLVGVIASLSTCMATTGALYLATIGKLHDNTTSFRDKMIPALTFNAGRIITYTILGAVNGFVGQVLTKDLQVGSTMNVLIGILMVFVGLDMLRILPFDRILPNKWYKNFLLKMQGRLLKHPRQTAFMLGVITYWLPCGFTQSVQLYALSIADPVQSALIMLFFALGTTPVLLLMGYATSVMKSNLYVWFMKVVAVLVTMVGIVYILNFLTLYGLNPLQPLFAQFEGKTQTVKANEEGGEQVIRMTVTNAGYTPSSFTVEKGRPVKWIIEGKEVFGCQAYLVAPKIEVETVIKKGQNIISFYPKETGKIGFSCTMGMYNGEINVI